MFWVYCKKLAAPYSGNRIDNKLHNYREIPPVESALRPIKNLVLFIKKLARLRLSCDSYCTITESTKLHNYFILLSYCPLCIACILHWMHYALNALCIVCIMHCINSAFHALCIASNMHYMRYASSSFLPNHHHSFRINSIEKVLKEL